jgi:hypothetical protein
MNKTIFLKSVLEQAKKKGTKVVIDFKSGNCLSQLDICSNHKSTVTARTGKSKEHYFKIESIEMITIAL